MAGSIDKTFDCGIPLPGFLGGGFTPTPGCDCPHPPPPPPPPPGGPQWDGDIPLDPTGPPGQDPIECKCRISGTPLHEQEPIWIKGVKCVKHTYTWPQACKEVDADGNPKDDPSYDEHVLKYGGSNGFEIENPPVGEDCKVGGLCIGTCNPTVMTFYVCPTPPTGPTTGGPGGRDDGGPTTPGGVPGGPGTPQPHGPPGPGGPYTPGPGGPGTPKGNPPGCRCRIAGSPSIKITPFWRSSAGTSFEEIEGGQYCLSTVCTWQQECKYIMHPPDGDPPDDPSFGEYEYAFSGEPGFEIGGVKGEDCIEQGPGTAGCTGKCEPIKMSWHNCIWTGPVSPGQSGGVITPKGPQAPPGPSTPGPAGPGTPKGGPQAPPGPTTPGPGGPGTPRSTGDDYGGGLIIINPDDADVGGGLLSSAQDKKSELSLNLGDRNGNSIKHI